MTLIGLCPGVLYYVNYSISFSADKGFDINYCLFYTKNLHI